MKKAACVVFALIMVIFLINPLSIEARGGPGGGHGGSHGGHGGGHWGWIPFAIAGTMAIISSLISSPPTVAREQPPVNQPLPSVTPSENEKIFVYPRQGQSEQVQAKDRYECHAWAVDQTKYDPTQSTVNVLPEVQRKQMRSDYMRALSACLDGRGYTMR